MTWYYYEVDNLPQRLPAVEALNLTQAWLKNITRLLQEQFNQQDDKYLDAVKEQIVDYPTVHHYEHFQQHYDGALAFFKQQNFLLNEDKEIFVLWLPSEYGYCHCAFLMPVMGKPNTTIIVSPDCLPMLSVVVKPHRTLLSENFHT